MATSYSVQLRPTAPTDTVTQRDVSHTLDDDYEVGSFIDGSKYVVAPNGLTIESQSPAWTGHKNGATIDTDAVTHGFDDRTDGGGFGPGGFYDNADRTAFPATIAGSDTPRVLIGVESTADLSNHSDGIESAEAVTILRTAPSRPSFRPPYVGTSWKPLYTRADVNYGLLPGLAVPSGTTLPDWTLARYGRRLRLDIGPDNAGRGTWNLDAGDWYPPYDAPYIGDAMLGSLLNIPEARSLADRVIQYGLDMYAVARSNSQTFICNGGFGWGRLVPVVYAGMLLGNTDMQNAAALTIAANGVTVSKFGEPGYCFYGVGGVPLFGINHPAETAFFRNHIMRDLNGLVNPHQIDNITGVCGSGSTTTEIVLDSAATAFESGNGATDDYYYSYILKIGNEVQYISDWVGASKIATVYAPFESLGGAPTAGTPYSIRLSGVYMSVISYVTGHALVARLLGMESVLGASPWLDFMDQWVTDGGEFAEYPAEHQPVLPSPTTPYGSHLSLKMWGAYR